ncbi:MAG: glutathione-disulfide reductase [Gammaproteobacteria bacterium]|nr:MAG: glutathione-disulfide reductase [Gammaproteobacteria bacterium]
MSNYDYDLIVIGAGSGGVRAARMSAGFGAKVAVIEDRYMGGTCVNVGCVPKKLYVYASEFRQDFAAARNFGWDSHTPNFDWHTLRDSKKDEISRLNRVYDNMLDGAGVDIIDGRGTLVDAHTVAVNGKHYSAGKILLATGGWPFVPDFPGSEWALTSNEIFDLDTFPKRLAIVGGGYIACEFAGIFNGLGAKVTQVYRGELFLRGFDEDVRRHLETEMRRAGVDIRLQSNVERIEQQADNSLALSLSDGSALEADAVLYATGRKPNINGLGLDHTNVTLTEKGTIAVNEYFQTKEPSIYAVGDLIGGMELTPVALAEGMAFARREFGDWEKPVAYDFIPTAVFTQPNIGTVGYTEQEAREKFAEITVFKTSFRPMKQSFSGSEEKTLMKLIVNNADDRVIGLHMVGPDAGEIVQGMAIAMRAGATKATFDSTIGIHPTAAEEFVTMREPWQG